MGGSEVSLHWYKENKHEYVFPVSFMNINQETSCSTCSPFKHQLTIWRHSLAIGEHSCPVIWSSDKVGPVFYYLYIVPL